VYDFTSGVPIFANGAITGAFQNLFNQQSQKPEKPAQEEKEYDFRKVDAKPDEFTRADLIDEGINKIVNSPDGKIFIRTDLDANRGYYIQKNGDQLSFPAEKASATFEVLGTNEVKLSNIVGGKGVKNVTITARDNGVIKLKGIPFLYRAIVPTKFK
jgi:hypothetical protein